MTLQLDRIAKTISGVLSFRRNMNDWERESLFYLMCNVECFNMKTRAAEALSYVPNVKEYTV